jgi:YVTN family beta-propeller protein
LYVPNTANANSVSVVDVAANAVAATVPMPATPLQAIVTPDGRYVYVLVSPSASLDYMRIVAISTRDNSIAATIALTGTTGCIGMALSPDGTRLYANCSPQGSVVATASNQVVGALPAFLADRMVVTQDGRFLYYGENVLSGSFFSRVDLATLEIAPVDNPGSGYVVGLAPSQDGGRLYVGHSGPFVPRGNNAPAAIAVHDPVSGDLLATWTIDSTQGANGFAISPDSQVIYVAVGNVIDVVETTTGRVIRSISNPAVSLFLDLAVTPDGRYLYSTQQLDASIVRVDVTTGAVSFLSGFSRPVVASAAMTPLPVAQAQIATAVEYFHPAWGYYFVTPSPKRSRRSTAGRSAAHGSARGSRSMCGRTALQMPGRRVDSSARDSIHAAPISSHRILPSARRSRIAAAGFMNPSPFISNRRTGRAAVRPAPRSSTGCTTMGWAARRIIDTRST